MVLGEYPGEGRERLLGPVLVIARNKDDVPAFPKTALSIVHQRHLTKDGKGKKSGNAYQDGSSDGFHDLDAVGEFWTEPE